MQCGSLALVSRKEGPTVWQFRWSEKDLHGSSCPAETSDCSVRTTGTARRGRTKRGTREGTETCPFGASLVSEKSGQLFWKEMTGTTRLELATSAVTRSE